MKECGRADRTALLWQESAAFRPVPPGDGPSRIRSPEQGPGLAHEPLMFQHVPGGNPGNLPSGAPAKPVQAVAKRPRGGEKFGRIRYLSCGLYALFKKHGEKRGFMPLPLSLDSTY